jgi:hypothetical protein
MVCRFPVAFAVRLATRRAHSLRFFVIIVIIAGIVGTDISFVEFGLFFAD